MFAEETRLKSQSNWHQEKGIIPNPPSVFAAPFHKGKPQGRADIGSDECAFCKEKGHWKAQCPKLLKANRTNCMAPSSNVVSPVAPTMVGTSQASDLVAQFQKFLSTQPHVMSAPPGSIIQEAD